MCIRDRDYTSYCDALGLSDGLGLTAYQSITRGQAAVLLYRTIRQTMNGSQQAFYETIDGVASTADVILLETGAEHGGSTGLLMTYSLSGTDGLAYYSQSRTQSEVLEGSMGTLLLNSAGQVMGFVPEDGDSIELTIADATASVLTAQDGTEYRISSGAIVVSGGESTSYKMCIRDRLGCGRHGKRAALHPGQGRPARRDGRSGNPPLPRRADARRKDAGLFKQRA